MEILGKLGAALTGFWWSLDERERVLVIYIGFVMAAGSVQLLERRANEERDELAETDRARRVASAVADELERRGARA